MWDTARDRRGVGDPEAEVEIMVRRRFGILAVIALLCGAIVLVGSTGPPAGAADDGPDATGDLWVSSTISVFRYDADTGAPVPGRVEDRDGGLQNGQGIAFGPDGNLYVSSFETREVLRYDGTTGDFIDVFVPFGSGGMGAPNDVAFGPDGDLYVADGFFGTGSILRYDGSTGSFLEVYASGAGLRHPSKLAFGPDGSLFVGNATTSDVLRFRAGTGEPFPSAGNPGAVFVAGVAGPVNTAVAVGPDGDLYVASGATSAIDRYDGTTGESRGTFVAGVDTLDMVFGPDGDLFATDYLGNAVQRFDGATGALIGPFVAPGSDGLRRPTSLEFAPPDDGPCRTLTSSLRLRGDETCDIHVAASGVTIDLDGHRLTGDITTDDGLSNVVVRDGEVRGHIDLSGTTNGKIDHVTVRGGGAEAGTATKILSSRFVSSPEVALVVDRDRVEVRSSTFEDGGGDAILLGATRDSLVNGVTVRDNDGIGILATDGCSEAGPWDVVVKNSTFERNLHGVVLGRCGGGVNGDIVVERNDFLRQRGSGLVLDLDNAPAPGTEIDVRDNRFVGNGRGGSDVFDDGISSVLEIDFGEYAPHPIDEDVTISRNVAVLNRDLGIDAEGAIDGGGNRARKNGNDLQCVGVVCRR